MIRYVRSVPLIVLLALGACQKPDKLTESEEKVIINSVQQMLRDYFNDIRANGLIAEFKYLDNSPEFFWVPPGYLSWISHDSVASVLQKNAPAYRSIDNTWDTIRVDPLTHEYATYTGRLHGTWLDTSGRVTKVSLIETGVVVKRKDGWKLLKGQTSALPEELQ